MGDEEKGDSKAKAAPRHDLRAEPDSNALPEPEALVTGRRRVDSSPVPRSPSKLPGRPEPLTSSRGSLVPPSVRSYPTEGEARGLSASRSPSQPAIADGSETTALRKQVAQLQAELAQTQKRLANLQEARVEDGDRIADLVARLNSLAPKETARDAPASLRGASVSAARSEPELDDDALARTNAAYAQAAADAAADAEEQVRSMAQRLSESVAALDAARTEQERLAAALERARGEAAEARRQVSSAVELLAAVEASEDEQTRVRDDAAAKRTQLGDRLSSIAYLLATSQRE